MMKTYLCTNIKYDTDGQRVRGLPKKLVVEVENEEDIADAISDHIGWCVESLDYKESTRPKYR